MVIARYITKEILASFLAIISILMFIALSNKFVVFLARAAAGKLPVSLVFKVIGLYIPEIFCVLAPIALFVAILFTHSRLHAESEVAVLLTSGFDWLKITKITMVTAVLISIIVAVLNLGFAPLITAKREQVINDGNAIGVMHAITPGRIQMVDGNQDLVFYVENIDAKGILHKVFIVDNEHDLVITAERAVVKQLNDANEFFLVLQHGYRYGGVAGHADYTVTKFAEYGRELKFPSAQMSTPEYSKPTGELLKSNSPADQAELQWRYSMPFAVLVLALLAIPVAKVNPRQGRYAKFLPAALIYMMYYNFLTVVKRWIAAGDIAVYPGLWAVHLLFLFLAIAFFLKVSGRWHEYYRSLHR